MIQSHGHELTALAHTLIVILQSGLGEASQVLSLSVSITYTKELVLWQPKGVNFAPSAHSFRFFL